MVAFERFYPSLIPLASAGAVQSQSSWIGRLKMTPNELLLRFEQVDRQIEGPVTRLVGFVRARNLLPLLDAADLEANPRQAKVGPVTADIIESIETTPELFPFKTKGVLVAAASCRELERRRFQLTFENNAIEGILDGGHNTLAIGLHILGLALGDPKALKKVKRWPEFKEAWVEHREAVAKLRASAASGEGGPLDFLVPIEVLVPTDPEDDVILDRFTSSLLEIGAARNNNVELTLETKANKKGYYDELRKALQPRIANRVEWKTNDGGDVKVRDLVALAWIPLSLAPLPEGVSAPAATKIYSGKGDCAKAFDLLMSHESVSKATGGEYTHELHNTAIGSALAIAGQLPELYERINAAFPGAYNANGGSFGLLRAVTAANNLRTKPTTPFLKQPRNYRYPDGLILPLVYGLKALIKADESGHLSWRTDPSAFLDVHLEEIVRKYRVLITAFAGDPQKIGKNEGSYALALDAFETELLKLRQAA
jgi:hypothetical protein